MSNYSSKHYIILLFFLIVGFLAYGSKYIAHYPKNDLLSQFDVSSFESKKKDFGVRVISIDSSGAEPSEMTIFFDKNDGSTKIIELSHGGETFRNQLNFYFYDISNFFVVERFQQWDRPYSESGRVLQKEEISRFLFQGLIMVSWVDQEGKLVGRETGRFRSKEEELQMKLQVLLDKIAE